MNFHFRPKKGCTADIIPFFWNNEYHLFYLNGNDDLYKRFDSTWEHIVSKDLINWNEKPQVIIPDADDSSSADYTACWTGCVFYHNEEFHIFYCGLNRKKEQNQQTICHATSKDLNIWIKDTGNPILVADERWYETNDWRDPFVYYNEEEHKFWMLVTARKKHGPSERRACIGLAESSDLVSWNVREPLFSPSTGYSFECMDVFKHNKGMFLIYSTYVDNYITQYRYSKSGFSGLSLTTYEDAIDSSRFYAAKTLHDGKRRIAFGWIPDRKDSSDDEEWLWGGNLAMPHVLKPKDNGTLDVSYPKEFKRLFKFKKYLKLTSRYGNWKINNGNYEVQENGFACCLTEDAILEPFYLSFKINTKHIFNYLGFIFDSDSELNNYYSLRFEPRYARVGVYRYPERQKLAVRPYSKIAETVKIEIFYCDNILEVFVDDRLAITTRTYPKEKGRLGIFAEGANARFFDIEFRTQK